MRSRQINNSKLKIGNFKLLVLVVAALLPVASYAQSADTDSLQADMMPVVDKGLAQQFVEIKPYVAAGASTLLLNYEKVVPGATNVITSPGSIWRAGVDVKFCLNNFIGLATGIAFEIAANQYAMSIVDNTTGTINSVYVDNNFNQVCVPVYLSWCLRMSSRLALNIDTGWYLGFGVSGHMKVNGYSTGQNSLGQPVITPVRFETDYFNAERSLVNGVRDRDNGVHLALGLTLYRHFSLKAVLNVSARNLAINHDVIPAHYRNINFAGEFGYCF